MIEFPAGGSGIYISLSGNILIIRVGQIKSGGKIIIRQVYGIIVVQVFRIGKKAVGLFFIVFGAVDIAIFFGTFRIFPVIRMRIRYITFVFG